MPRNTLICIILGILLFAVGYATTSSTLANTETLQTPSYQNASYPSCLAIYGVEKPETVDTTKKIITLRTAHYTTSQEAIIAMITRLSEEYGVDKEAALRIAKCESGYNPLAKNPHSSASGLYQFLTSTWAHNCSGDIWYAEDNAACFMENYNQHPNWWVCT